MGKTSAKSKRKYNNGAYTVVRAELDKELIAQWKAALKEDELTQAGFIREAMQKYLNERKDGAFE
ncbi:MAG: hypothetical protein LBQ48_01540 [Oscillospiraceae bacterium]|jgi:hypothetical protein|nr:hypothetical protein [Oscillospiraceae bacterium]